MGGRSVRRRCSVLALVATLLIGVPTSVSAASRIAFSKHGDLFTILPDGSGLRRLTQGGPREHEPAWSPDRRRLAFIAWDRRIVVTDAQGDDRRRLFTLPRPYDQVLSLAWSPDGRWIAFATVRYERAGGLIRDCGQIWLMGADGSNPHRIVWHEPHITGITWSPNGRWLAAGFEHQNMTVDCGDDRPLGIARVRVDGTGLRSLGVPLGTDPDWSPGGRWIAYRDWRRTCHACGEIWLVSKDGARNRPFARPPAGEGGIRHPAWAPDGHPLAAIGEHLWIVRPGGVARRLAIHVTSVDW